MSDKPEKFQRKFDIRPASGKLGVLIPGMSGAVSTTFIAGVKAVMKGVGRPIGSLTQMGKIRIGLRTEKNFPLIKDFVPLAKIEDMVFAGWDIYDEDCYASALRAGVLKSDLIEKIKPDLQKESPMRAVFNNDYVKNLKGPHVKRGKTKMHLAEQLIKDIRKFQKQNDIERLVMLWCASTEIYLEPSEVHETIESFEKGLRENHEDISPSMIYAYAAIRCGAAYGNGAPNLSVDIPALGNWRLKTRFP